jgi:DNA-binding transcriptional regulator GbsR (MarR family)
MKKNTIEALVAHLNGETVTNLDEIKAELEAELSKGKEKADANRALYEEIHDAVMEVLRSATVPVTAQELAEETGYAKGKIVYGLRNYWAEEVEKTEGKVNTYSAKKDA